MKKLRKFVRENPHIAISVPALLCALTFVTNLWWSLQDGYIDPGELEQLRTTADGFEALVLFLTAMVLKK